VRARHAFADEQQTVSGPSNDLQNCVQRDRNQRLGRRHGDVSAVPGRSLVPRSKVSTPWNLVSMLSLLRGTNS
jgi:hypothetical protein